MNQETISTKQGIAIICLFMTGTSSILVFGLSAEKDIWIANIISVLMALFMVFIFSRIHLIFPEQNLFDVCETCCGKYIGKTIIILFSWFALHEGTLVAMNIYQFIKTIELLRTPSIIIMIILMFLCTWIVKNGIEVIGRFSVFFIVPFIIFVFIAVLFLIPLMEINNIRPILHKGIYPILRGAYDTFSFPFGEIVVFAMIFSSSMVKKSLCKVYTLGLLLGGLIVWILSVATMLVLGLNITLINYYPVYVAMGRIDVEKLESMEVMAAVIFMLGGFIKVSIYLLAASKGIAKTFNFSDYRFLVTPIALLMINFSSFLHDGRLDYIDWNLDIFPHYAFLFEAILPIFILIFVEIKKRRMIIR